MSDIEHVVIEASGSPADPDFYETAFGLGDRVQLRAGQAPSSGFRGFVLGLVMPQPADADHFFGAALDAGATSMKEPRKSLWGYGGTLQALDGDIVTVASSAKKNIGAANGQITDVVLQLGVADVAASKRFYQERGFMVAKSFGGRYVEFDTGGLTLTLNPRRALAKTVGVSAEEAGVPGITIFTSGADFTDPDGFAWENA